MPNKNFRRSYEKLYKRLCEELDTAPLEVKDFSDNELLQSIKELLIKWECTPLTEKELQMELI